MSGVPGAVIEGPVAFILVVIALAIVIAFARLVAGPTLPDRVVALDMVATLAVGIIAASAVAFDEPALLQPALVVALIAFVGTVAFARYLERRQR
ncbi:MAG: cation:proton antiporter [Vicinamibacterales bacterium]